MANRLIESMKEAVTFAKGDISKGQASKHKTIKAVNIPEDINPHAIRQKLNMTQEEFRHVTDLIYIL